MEKMSRRAKDIAAGLVLFGHRELTEDEIDQLNECLDIEEDFPPRGSSDRGNSKYHLRRGVASTAAQAIATALPKLFGRMDVEAPGRVAALPLRVESVTGYLVHAAPSDVVPGLGDIWIESEHTDRLGVHHAERRWLVVHRHFNHVAVTCCSVTLFVVPASISTLCFLVNDRQGG